MRMRRERITKEVFVAALTVCLFIFMQAFTVQVSAAEGKTVDAGEVGTPIIAESPEADGENKVLVTERSEYSASAGYEITASGEEKKKETAINSVKEKKNASSNTKSNSVTWELSGGVLTISGSGAMTEYNGSNMPPWYDRRSEINEVVIEHGVTGIGEIAFYELYNLKKVTIASGVKKIGIAAFYGCRSLKNLTIPEGVTELCDYFLEGSGVGSINLPASITAVSKIAFFAAPLTEINVNANNTKYRSISGVLYSKDGTKLLVYPSRKPGDAFTVPAGTNTVGEYAFTKAVNLKRLDLNKVTTIGEGAFARSSLEQMTFPDAVKNIGDMVLESCEKLTTVTFGKGIKEIPYRTCYECVSLKQIDFGLAESIGQAAFAYTAMENLVLPKTIKKAGVASFGECSKLKTVRTQSLGILAYQTFFMCTSLSSVTLNEGIHTIYREVFYRCENLKNLTTPASCTWVHEQAAPTTTSITNKNKNMRKYGLNGYIDTLTVTGTQKYNSAYEVLELVNKERNKNGLSALKMDKQLMDDAMMRAGEITVLFSHRRPSDQGVVGEWGFLQFIPGLSIVEGENIAYGYSSPTAVMKGWMNSQGHKENILTSSWTNIGIGCFEYNGVLYWVQLFSTRSSSTSFSKPADKKVATPVHIEENSFFDSTDNNQVEFQFDIEGTKTIGIGKTSDLKLTLGNVTFNSNSVDWKTSDSSVVSIDANGKIKGKKVGKSKITAYSRGYERASCTVTVSKDGSAFGKGASAAATEKAITSLKSDKDPKGTVFSILQLRSTKQTNKSITLKWKKVSKAEKYVIYGNACGKKNKMKWLATSKGVGKSFKEIAGKKLKKGKYYKFIVIALDKNENVISSSKVIHVATKGGKAGNHKKMTVKAKQGNKTKAINSATIKKGKTLKLKAKAIPEKNKKVAKHVNIRYESSNKKIATVTAKGKIKARKKGSCTVYVFAQNGIMKKIKVKVK